MLLAHHGFSESWTSPEVLVVLVFGSRHTISRLARHSRGRCLGLSQPVGTPGIWALVIPPPFFNPGILTVDSFIDISGQKWSGIATLRTLLQQTVIQRGLPPRWPKLPQVGWHGEKCEGFPGDKEALSGNTVWRLMKHTKRDTPIFRLVSCSLRTTNIMSVVEQHDRNPHCFSGGSPLASP